MSLYIPPFVKPVATAKEQEENLRQLRHRIAWDRFMLLFAYAITVIVFGFFIAAVVHGTELEPLAHYRIVDGVHLPDLKYSPGVVRHLSLATICKTKWGVDRRHVSEAMRDAAYKLYGVVKKAGVCCEADHVASRELAGADVIKNLFPQPWAEARLKDRLENRLHKEVCAKTITLKQAQQEIMVNWWTAYKKRFG